MRHRRSSPGKSPARDPVRARRGKAGKPEAPRKPAHALGLTFIAADFDAAMPDIEAAFEGAAEENDEVTRRLALRVAGLPAGPRDR
jgi:hypothetical protein